MDDQMFRTVMRGFDKEEVFAYIKQIEADANQKVAQARADVIEKDKQIAELKQRSRSLGQRIAKLKLAQDEINRRDVPMVRVEREKGR